MNLFHLKCVQEGKYIQDLPLLIFWSVDIEHFYFKTIKKCGIGKKKSFICMNQMIVLILDMLKKIVMDKPLLFF